MLDPEARVLEEVVHHDAVSPDVSQVRHRGAAVVLSDIHCDIDVQRVLFNLLVRQSVFSDEGVGAQVEDKYGRRADLFRSFREFRFTGIENPQTVALLRSTVRICRLISDKLDLARKIFQKERKNCSRDLVISIRITWLMPVPVRRRRYAGLPLRQSNKDFIAPNVQAQGQIILRDVVTLEYSIIPRIDTVEFKINRGPGVYLLESN
ncbi:hypothetical protein PUN28_016384 [Cardiocondyla obscurior]|uniref:Uncharacterized protein n=1 Tax=Cardiocondyla obscurior TaxID=286306 RepID=A0AAW2EQS7_9HYME